MISMIAAMNQNRVIGYKNQLPWHLPNDLKYFKKMTLNKPIIMGRKTFDSLGKPLPNRKNIVISRQENLTIKGAEVFTSLTEAIESVKNVPEIMITGGATLYEQALPLADRMYLTVIDYDCQGDTFFPQWNSNHWQTIDCQSYKQSSKNPLTYKIITLQKK